MQTTAQSSSIRSSICNDDRSNPNSSVGPDRGSLRDTKGSSSRRVPYESRQRVEVSCDRCKKRKIRCKRLKGPEKTCEGCEKNGLSCESTLPRKERSYTRSDINDPDISLPLAIIRRLVPERTINSSDDLVQLARDLGLDFPSAERCSQTYTSRNGSIGTSRIPNIPSTVDNTENTSLGAKIPIPEGRLLPAPAGGYHYVGPASSIYFAMTVRHLVSRTNRIWMAATEGNVFERIIKAAEFTSFGVSKALEARIEGHPSTNAANDEGETHPIDPSPIRLDNYASGPSRNSTSPLNYLRHGRWRSLLPDRDIADRLVQAFFDIVHPNYTLFHRGSFYTNYEALWSWDGDRLGSIDAGWICALMMVLVLGALALEGTTLKAATEIQQRYLTIVLRDGFPRLNMTASLFNVQTLMLLALYQHNAGERNGAWMLIGQAARMAIALGMHRDGDVGNFDPIERNTRRMVWWILYTFEQNMSFVLGRPSATDIIDRTVRLPDESFMDGHDIPSSFFGPSGSLAELSVGIKRFVASISVDYDRIELLARSHKRAQELYGQLDEWYHQLPQHLHPQSSFSSPKHRRAVLLLHIHYRYIRSILGRPFLLGMVSHEVDNQSTPDLVSLPVAVRQMAELSIEAARTSVNYLHDLAAAHLLEGQVWLDMFYVHHATFILGLPLLSCPVQDSRRFQLDKIAVSDLLAICQKMVIAPTYRILLNIAMQFTYVIDWGPKDLESVPPAGAPGGSFNTMTDVQTDGRTQSREAQPSQQLAWDQLFGPLPSRQSSPRDLFADLYNFGLDPDPDTQVPWDFFNLSALATQDPAGEHPQGGMSLVDPSITAGSFGTDDPEIQSLSGITKLLPDLG